MANTTRFLLGNSRAATLFGVFLVVLLVAYCTLGNGPPSERRVTFLAINDVYRLDGIAEGKSGGLTRVRTLRKWMTRDAPNAILLHAGDFLSPSLISKVFKGEQMIDAMNRLDGDPKGFDSRMFVVFGNHEFNDSTCNKADAPLNARVGESQFTWLASNLDFPNCPSMSGMLNRNNVKKDGVIIDANNVKVGLFGIGLTPDKKGAPKYPRFEEALPAVRRSIAHLREMGAELIVALTHLPREDDEALLQELSLSGLDLVVGGHDHANMVLFGGGKEARGFKADSDARTAWRIDVQMPKQGKPRIEAQLITLNEAVPPDADLVKLAQSWSAKAEQKLCADLKSAEPNCLAEPVGRTQSLIELEETANRTQETGFGNWLADLIAKQAGADVAIVNSGILGLNEDLAPGASLLMRHIVDVFRYDDVVAMRSFPARQVCAAVAHGFAIPGMGAWPHVSGVEVELNQSQGGYAAAVTRFRSKPGFTCESDEPVTVASVPFVLCSGDGYLLLPPRDECIKELEAKPLGDDRESLKLSALAKKAIRDAGNAGIRPEKDGRLRFAEPGGGK